MIIRIFILEKKEVKGEVEGEDKMPWDIVWEKKFGGKKYRLHGYARKENAKKVCDVLRKRHGYYCRFIPISSDRVAVYVRTKKKIKFKKRKRR